MAASIIRWTCLLLLVLASTAAMSGCHSVKDAWDSRGVPQQWEPE